MCNSRFWSKYFWFWIALNSSNFFTSLLESVHAVTLVLHMSMNRFQEQVCPNQNSDSADDVECSGVRALYFSSRGGNIDCKSKSVLRQNDMFNDPSTVSGEKLSKVSHNFCRIPQDRIFSIKGNEHEG